MRRYSIIQIAVAILVAWAVPSTVHGYGQSVNQANKIGIYDIQYYGQQYDAITRLPADWKPQIPVSNYAMSTQALYDSFDCADANLCGSSTSYRITDSSVSVANMNEVGWNWGWKDDYSLTAASMLFFYGHNISPRVYDALYAYNRGDSFPAWFPAGTVTDAPGAIWGPVSGNWQQVSLCSGYPGLTDSCARDIFQWGTTSTPFYYHWTGSQVGQYGVQDASWTSPAYSVFYGYNPLTSVLVGKDWTWSTWPYANVAGAQVPAYGQGRLGDDLAQGELSTNFLIANGCEALPVAAYSEHYPGGPVGAGWVTEGINAWKASWGSNLHAVMGHTEGTNTDNIPNLFLFSDMVLSQVGVIEAYFLAHSRVAFDKTNPLAFAPSAIAPRDVLMNGQDVYSFDTWYPREEAPAWSQIVGKHYKSWFMYDDSILEIHQF